MARGTVNQVAQLGLESTAGTPVTPTFQLALDMFSIDRVITSIAYRRQGSKLPNAHVKSKQSAVMAASGPADYNSLAVWGRAAFGKRSPVVVSTVGTWEIGPSIDGIDVLQTLTARMGDGTYAKAASYVVVNALTIKGNRDSVDFTAAGFGQKISDSTLASTNEVQTATVTGTLTAGFFTLTWLGQTTAHIAFDAIGSAVQSAFLALPNVGTGNATITGSAGGPFIITFIGNLAGRDVALITTDSSGLVGGTIAVATTTPGTPTVLPQAPITPDSVSVYLDPTIATAKTTKLLGLKSWEIGFTAISGPNWVVDSALPSFKDHVPLAFAPTLKLVLEDDAQGRALLTQFDTSAIAYLVVEAIGVNVPGSSTPYNMQLTVPFEVIDGGNDTDDAGVWAINFNCGPIGDPLSNYGGLHMHLVNALVA